MSGHTHYLNAFLKHIILFLLLFSTKEFIAQENLVLNPSFEDTSLWGGIEPLCCNYDVCKHWRNGNSVTADYFTSNCADGIWGPWFCLDSDWFNIAPRTGEAFIGLALFHDFDPLVECVQGELLEELKPNTFYEISGFVSLADSSGYRPKYLDVGFETESRIDFSQPQLIYSNFVSCNISESEPGEWIQFSGKYQAIGGEKLIYLGSNTYFEDFLVSALPHRPGANPWPSHVYIGIDDLNITEVECGAISIPNVITPNNDGINDQLDLRYQTGDQLKIFNRWGELIFQFDQSHQSWDAHGASDGVYFITGKHQDCIINQSIQVVR